jgi:hypothetical protein
VAYRARAFPRVGMLLPIIYLIVGAFVAASNHYFSHTAHLAGVVNAVLAILLWPLVLLGLHFHIT